MTDNPQYDVAIVGASLAGCAAAILFGKRGMKVALIERDPRLSAYKKVCTHLIQSSATPAVERLGLAAPIEAAGGVRQVLEIYSEPWGWARDATVPKNRPAYGYNLRREKLDPLVREMAANIPGVDFMPGHSVEELLVENGRAVGLKAARSPDASRTVRARLVVAADGRYSPVAQLAGVKGKVTPNARFLYTAYYSGLAMPKGSTTQIFFLNPGWASAMQTDDGLVLLGTMPTKDQLQDWKGNIEDAFSTYFDAIPQAPSPRDGKRESPFLGMLEMPHISRPAVHSGIAFIGDACMAVDPLWGVGCGFAFQTAEWLADNVADALGGSGDLDGALKRYQRHHKRQLAGHEFVMTDYMSGRKRNAIEILMNSAAARDPVCAAHLLTFGTRNSRLPEFLTPSAIARSAWVNVRHRLRHGKPDGRREEVPYSAAVPARAREDAL